MERHSAKKMKKNLLLLKNNAFFIVFTVALILSFVLTAPIGAGFDKINQKKVQQIVTNAEKGIQMEADYLLSQSIEMDESRVFDRFISDSDSAGLISLSTEEARKRGMGEILIANRSGQVLSRVNSINQRGDFISNSTFGGREAFENGKSSGIDRGTTHPVIIFGAKSLEREGQISGLIVSAQILDDNYAEIFADKYLPGGAKVAFFSTEEGLIGSNIESLEDKRNLEIYLSPNSGLADKNMAELKVSFNGENYLVKNIVFESGYDDPIGNMVVFVPSNYSQEALALSFIVTLFFILFCLVAVYFNRHMHKPARLVATISLGVIVVFSLTYFYSKDFFRKEYLPLSSPPYLIYNSVMTINPNSATISTNFEQLVSVDILSGGESINVAEVEIKYDPTLLMVEEIRTTNSFCSQDLFIEREIDNDNGLVRVVCGLPSPGFNELRGTVFELAIRALKPGPASLWFGDNTAVFANDGLGTNVLRDSIGASYIVVADEMLEKSSTSSGPLLFSPTHPNLARWYNHRAVIFTWLGLDTYRYQYTLDRNDTVELEGDFEKTDSVASFEVSADGMYYFHLFAKDTEGVVRESQYQVKIDSTPPDAPLIKASTLDARVGEVVRFEFSSDDELSGLQSGFYVKLKKNGTFFPTGPQLFIAFPKKGEHKIVVRVFDRANNYSESSKVINVR